jgi:hypothetical protein
MRSSHTRHGPASVIEACEPARCSRLNPQIARDDANGILSGLHGTPQKLRGMVLPDSFTWVSKQAIVVSTA